MSLRSRIVELYVCASRASCRKITEFGIFWAYENQVSMVLASRTISLSVIFGSTLLEPIFHQLGSAIHSENPARAHLRIVM